MRLFYAGSRIRERQWFFQVPTRHHLNPSGPPEARVSLSPSLSPFFLFLSLSLIIRLALALFLCGLATTPRLPDRIHTRPRFYDNAISCARVMHTVCVCVYTRARSRARACTEREERFNNFASPRHAAEPRYAPTRRAEDRRARIDARTLSRDILRGGQCTRCLRSTTCRSLRFCNFRPVKSGGPPRGNRFEFILSIAVSSWK